MDWDWSWAVVTATVALVVDGIENEVVFDGSVAAVVVVIENVGAIEEVVVIDGVLELSPKEGTAAVPEEVVNGVLKVKVGVVMGVAKLKAPVEAPVLAVGAITGAVVTVNG